MKVGRSEMSSSSNSPCAACKLQRRKCTQECVFAPYFPPDNPERFFFVHRVFGASNVAKILADLDTSQREDAVKSLAYEAEARLRDPVYGCVGLISILQHKLKVLQTELQRAKAELATYVGHQAMQPTLQPPALMTQHHPRNPSSAAAFPYNNIHPSPTVIGQGAQFLVRDPQMLEAQAHLAAAMAAREQQQLMQREILRLNGGGYELIPGSSSSGGGFMSSPSMALGSVDSSFQFQPQQGEHHNHPLHHQLQAQLMLSSQESQISQQQHKLEREEAGRAHLSS